MELLTTFHALGASLRMRGGARIVVLLAGALLGMSAAARAEPPSSPATCAATDTLCGRVRITWEAPAEGGAVEEYDIRRDGAWIGSAGSGVRFFIDEQASPNVDHAYAVRARNADGDSPPCESIGRSLTAPDPPASFSASRDLCGIVRLAWEAPAGGGPVRGYRIARSSPPGGSFDLSAGLRFYEDAPGVDGVLYTIRAFNCEESVALQDTGRFVASPPLPPSSCAAAFESCSSLRVSWSPVSGAASGYVVLRGGGIVVDSVGPADTTVLATGLGAGIDHTFLVFSVNDCGRSALPCSASAPIPGPIGAPPPGSCSATRDSCAGIEISWTWAPSEAEWFRVMRTDNGMLVGTVDAGTNRIIDTSVAPGDTARYSVRAGNRCFVSTDSCTTFGVRPALPSAPLQCSASTDRCGQIRLSWLWPSEYLNQNIQGFRIYRRRVDQPSAPWDLFTAPPRIGVSTWDDSNVDPLVNYIYRIAAYSRCGETSEGCLVTGRAEDAPAVGALILPADGASNLQLPVRLEWQSRARATSYRLEIATDAAFTDTVVNTILAGTAYDLAEVSALGTFHWRARARNACGEGPLYPARSFTVSAVPGLTVVSGSTSFSFGNGVDSVFADSVLVLENRWTGHLAWITQDTLPWITFMPPTGSLAPGGRVSVVVSVGDHRCGTAYADTVYVETNPVPPGHAPIPLAVSLLSEARPAGDVNWDCSLGADDAGRVLEALLGETLSSAAESTGADANGDGRINVADAVFLGRLLLEAPPRGPEKEGRVDLAFAPNDSMVEVSTDFRLRAVRFLFGAAAEDLPRLQPGDRERSFVRVDPASGRGAVFWFTLEEEGSERARLLEVEGPGAIGSLDARWIEIAGSGGELVRLSLGGRVLAPAAPSRLSLGEVRPNPFNALAAIPFALPEPARVRIAVHDVRGALVRTLLDETREAGFHEIRWAGDTNALRAAPSGAYFIRIEAGGESATRRALLVR